MGFSLQKNNAVDVLWAAKKLNKYLKIRIRCRFIGKIKFHFVFYSVCLFMSSNMDRFRVKKPFFPDSVCVNFSSFPGDKSALQKSSRFIEFSSTHMAKGFGGLFLQHVGRVFLFLKSTDITFFANFLNMLKCCPPDILFYTRCLKTHCMVHFIRMSDFFA